MLVSVRRLAFSILFLTAVGCAAAADKPKVGSEAKDFTLKAIGGETVELSKLTAKGPVVVVMLRGYPGYQCPLCTTQVGGLLKKADDFKKAGAQVLLVYPGPSTELQKRAEEFVKGKDYPANFHLLLDPDYTLTNAWGLRWEAKNETSYPSTFVVDGKGKVTFAKISSTHGDRSKVEDVIAALGK